MTHMTEADYQKVLERLKAAKHEGTPKTLETALGLIFTTCRGPTAIEDAKMILRDFMAQKMGIAMLSAKTEHAEDILGVLWTNLTGEKR